jgi:hypothetical protein
VLNAKPVYDVAVDQSGLEWESAGPLFERYTVALTGRLDRRWYECYKKITGDSSNYSGFRLEPAASNVSFTCRTTDGPVAVMTVMKKLEELLASVNRDADLALSTRTKSGAEPVAAPPAESGEKSRPAAGGFFARLTRTKAG